MSLDLCSPDLLISIAEYLSVKDFLTFSSCSRATYCLSSVECIWRRLCRLDFGILYNHPNQRYRTLYRNSCQRKFGNRLPCPHLSFISYQDRSTLPLSPYVVDRRVQSASNTHDIFELQQTCHRCDDVVDYSNTFLCIQPGCSAKVCDRHSRGHTRHHCDISHCVHLKMNMMELFCQNCLIWLGGVDSDPAEQHKTQLILGQWLPRCYPVPSLAKEIERLQRRRRYERYLRWSDTPRNIVNANDVVYVGSTWLGEWEMFVEGWRTEPPRTVINNDQWRAEIASSSSTACTIGFSPSAYHSCDLTVISHRIWSYLSHNYVVIGPRITEEDLLAFTFYKNWRKRLEYWKKQQLL